MRMYVCMYGTAESLQLYPYTRICVANLSIKESFLAAALILMWHALRII